MSAYGTGGAGAGASCRVLPAAGDALRKLICRRRVWSFTGQLRRAFLELPAPSWCSCGASVSRCGTVAVAPWLRPRWRPSGRWGCGGAVPEQRRPLLQQKPLNFSNPPLRKWPCHWPCSAYSQSNSCGAGRGAVSSARANLSVSWFGASEGIFGYCY